MPKLQTFDGLSLHYDVLGDRRGRQPVVMQHGYLSDGTLNWVHTGLAPALVAAGRQVVLLDARGHGRSDKPHDPNLYGEARMARDVSSLFDALALDQADLVGYSMGAIVALLCASGERRVRKLCVGGVGEAVVLLGGVDRRVLAPDALVEALLADDPAHIADPQAALFRAFADATGADRRAMIAQARSVHRAAIALERITAPTLIVAGRDDALAAHPERLQQAIAGARLELVNGDHLGALVDPRYGAALVEFLD
jgi:pimeloyl-ACP methyl ester carboxylesterase